MSESRGTPPREPLRDNTPENAQVEPTPIIRKGERERLDSVQILRERKLEKSAHVQKQQKKPIIVTASGDAPSQGTTLQLTPPSDISVGLLDLILQCFAIQA